MIKLFHSALAKNLHGTCMRTLQGQAEQTLIFLPGTLARVLKLINCLAALDLAK